MNNKKKIILNSGLSQVIYLDWVDDYEKKSVRYVLDSTLENEELFTILSVLIEKIITKVYLKSSFFMNLNDEFTYYDCNKVSALDLLKSTKFKHYFFLVAGSNVDVKKILKYLSKKWSNDEAYRFFPRNIDFIFGPATQDGDGYYFFLHPKIDKIFREELAKQCVLHSVEMICDANS